MYRVSFVQALLSICLLFGTSNAYPAQKILSWLFDSRSDVTRCLASNGVPFAAPSTPNWFEIYVPFNLRLIWEPAVVTIPDTNDQVSKSLTCAAAAGLKVQAKGGGHSYASYSNVGENGGMVISLEKFSEITVDQSRFTRHPALLAFANLNRNLCCEDRRWPAVG
jgi:hypothetical protein